jgi:hypothetical protein
MQFYFGLHANNYQIWPFTSFFLQVNFLDDDICIAFLRWELTFAFSIVGAQLYCIYSKNSWETFYKNSQDSTQIFSFTPQSGQKMKGVLGYVPSLYTHIHFLLLVILYILSPSRRDAIYHSICFSHAFPSIYFTSVLSCTVDTFRIYMYVQYLCHIRGAVLW